jgi:excisionase family DNA binding protein
MRATAHLELPDALLDELVQRAVADMRTHLIVEPEPWLNVSSAATYLDCPKKRIYDLVSQRRLRVSRDGSRLLFRRQWLDDVLSHDD